MYTAPIAKNCTGKEETCPNQYSADKKISAQMAMHCVVFVSTCLRT